MGFTGTRFVCALALGIVACGTAAAQVTPQQQSAMRANCRSDFMSKCSGVSPGGKEALTCLQKNVETLSAGCKSVVSATLPKPAPAAAAPAAPPSPAQVTVAPPAPATPPPPVAPPASAARPAATPPTNPRPATAEKPLAPKVAKPAPTRPASPKPVAPPPQTASAPPAPAATGPTPEQMSALKFTCRRDFGRVCKGVQAGGAEALACLQRNAARLSPNCKTSLADVADSVPSGGMPAAPAAAAAPVASPPPSPGPVDAAVMVRACKLDLIRHCRNAELGDGRKIACLNEHMADLTVRCRTALKVTAPIR